MRSKQINDLGFRTFKTLADRDSYKGLKFEGLRGIVYDDTTPSNNAMYELSSDLSTWKIAGDTTKRGYEVYNYIEGTTSLTLPLPSTANIIDFLEFNGRIQLKDTDYTITATDIVLTEAMGEDGVFVLYYFEKIGDVQSSPNDITSTSSNSFAIGDGSDSNKELVANTASSNKPRIRYNTTTSTWEYTIDSTNYKTFVSKEYVDNPIVESSYTDLGATPIIDLNQDVFKRTMNTTITNLSFQGGIEGRTYTLVVVVDSIGGYDFEYNYSQVSTQDGIEIIMPSEPNARHIYQITPLDGKYEVNPLYNRKTPSREYGDSIGGTTITMTSNGIDDTVA